MRTIPVKEVAFARSGDKGDISNVHVHPYRESDYDLLKDQLTVDRVAAAYDGLVDGPIERYEFEGIFTLNFVMHDALGGGVVGRTLNLDIHGKSRGNVLMDMEIEVPDNFDVPSHPTLDSTDE